MSVRGYPLAELSWPLIGESDPPASKIFISSQNSAGLSDVETVTRLERDGQAITARGPINIQGLLDH